VTTLSDGTVVGDYDTDGDGAIDITVIDEYGDGTTDAILDDADYDGQVDAVYVAGATMAVDEATGTIVNLNETGTTAAVYDPSTVPGAGPVDIESFPDRYVGSADPRRGDLTGRIGGGAAHSRYRQIGT